MKRGWNFINRPSHYGQYACFHNAGKSPVVVLLLLVPLALQVLTLQAKAADAPAIKVLLDLEPATLNPRMALDATGQRLDELMFRGLVGLTRDLKTEPALAESWGIEDGGRTLRFRMREDARDQEGLPISAPLMAACIENYRTGKPISPYASGFPVWTSTESRDSEVILHLSRPDPYMLRNLVLLRYFRTTRHDGSLGGERKPPCSEPQPGDTIVGSGLYRADNPSYDGLFPEAELKLWPTESGPRPLHFIFSIDENSKAIQLLRGDADVAQMSLSLAKTRWFRDRYSDRFRFLIRDGVPVSYLAFNLTHPILARKEVRRAIALAIDRESYAKYKVFSFASEAESLLAPMLPESASFPIQYDPVAAEKLLDQAGFPRGPDGVRFRLRLKTTPSRDGFEISKILQTMLARVGIELKLDIVEPAVFLASVRKRSFDLYASRWVGLADGSIFYRILRSGRPDNRVSYHNSEVDSLIDQAIIEPNDETRARLLRRVQEVMAEDLPYLPLWFWKVTVFVRKGLTGMNSEDLSLSASLVPLAKLR
jgi:peptide/nickel transport system substrate-binding protein